LLYYGVAEDGPKSTAIMDALPKSAGIEGQSHSPEVLYRQGKAEAAYDQILDLTSEGKNRREYPEVSYAVVGAIATGLMGLDVDGTVQTLPRLTAATEWVELDHVPVRANELNVRHDGVVKTTFTNSKGPSLRWRACFSGSYNALLVDGKTAAARPAQTISCTTVDVGSGDTRIVQVPK